MPAKVSQLVISPQKRISLERAFLGGNHKSVSAVALHVGVKREIAKAYLKHLISSRQLPKQNQFVKMQLKKK